MGCPAPKIVNNGEGAALMKDIQKAATILTAAVKAGDVPITVKCRTGWDAEHVNVVEFAKMAQDCGVSAITVHGRTRDQFYSGKADWDIIRDVKENTFTHVIGNGDIFTAQDALRMQQYTGCDGMMVGRGAQGNPFLFRQVKEIYTYGEVLYVPTLEEKISVLLEQIGYMIEEKGEYIAVREARKHASWYLKGEANSAKVRGSVNTANSHDDLKYILTSILQ
jgi:tRNA-dihydrouridine synthase B